MAVHLTGSDCKGSKAVDGTDDGVLWNDSEEEGDVSVSVRKVKALTVKI